MWDASCRWPVKHLLRPYALFMCTLLNIKSLEREAHIGECCLKYFQKCKPTPSSKRCCTDLIGLWKICLTQNRQLLIFVFELNSIAHACSLTLAKEESYTFLHKNSLPYLIWILLWFCELIPRKKMLLCLVHSSLR